MAERFWLWWTPFLKQVDGRTWQAVGVTVPGGRAAGGELTLNVGARKYTLAGDALLPYPGTVGSADQFLALVRQPARVAQCRATWKPERGRVQLATLTLQPARAMRVHLVRDVWSPLAEGTHSELLGFEDLCRSLYAAPAEAKPGVPPVRAAVRLSGAPAHTASLGMALAAAGVRIAVLDVEPGVRPEGIPPLFWWKLPDGQRLLVWYRPVGGADWLPPAEWAWNEWAVVAGSTAGASGADAEQFAQWARAHFDSPKWHVGRLEDFAAAVSRQHGADLPIIDKEFTDWSVDAVAERPAVAATMRRNRDLLASAEALGTLTAWMDGSQVDPSLARDTRTAYAQLADSAAASTPEQAAAVQTGVERITARATAASVRAFGAKGDADSAILLFNTLSWARGGVVRIGAAKLPSGEFELVDTSTGGAVIYERDAEGIEFFAPRVPACGYLRLTLRPVTQRSRPGAPAEWNARHLTLNTNEATYQYHAAGGLCRWHDRRHSMQWCSGSADYPTGAYLYEPLDARRRKAFLREAGPLAARMYPQMPSLEKPETKPLAIPRDARLCPLLGHALTRVRVDAALPYSGGSQRRGGEPRRWRLTYTLYHGRPELHVNLRILGWRAAAAAEAGYACFPFAIEEPYVLVDRIAHPTTPADDLAAGANAAYMAVHHGVRVEGYHAGMNFYPLDTPVIGFESPGAWRYARSGAYKQAALYATLFQHTGQSAEPVTTATRRRRVERNQTAGDLSFDFVMQPTGTDGWDGGLARGGMEYFRPLIAAVVNGAGGAASDSTVPSLLSVTPNAVQLVALKPAEFEAGYVLRLWNSRMDPVEAKVQFPAGRRGDELWRCDLVERTRRRVPMKPDGQARLKLGPHEVVTLLLRPA